MYLVGFAIETYYDAGPYERQIEHSYLEGQIMNIFIMQFHATCC